MAGNLDKTGKVYGYCMLLMIVLLAGFNTQAQLKRDTSFTLYGTYLKEKKARPYIEIANPVMPPSVKVQKDIVYRKIGDRHLLLDVFYPAKTKKRKPAVLMIFGGGWKSGDKTQNHAMAIELAKQGYVAVSAEYRLSGEAIYPAAVLDLEAAVAWMRSHAKQYGIDKKKIAALGCSAGGQLAALLGTTSKKQFYTGKNDRYNTSIQAIVDIDGVLAFKHPESSEGTVAALWLGGDAIQKPEIWKEASALTHVDKHTPPALFINSAYPRFHAGRNDMIKIMDSLGIYSEVHELPDTPHPFWFFHPWFDKVIGYTVGFLNRVFNYKQE